MGGLGAKPPMTTPRMDYFDGAKIAAGNGGWIKLSSTYLSGSSSERPINICKWAVKFINSVVPVAGSGQGGVLTYKTVATTAHVHVELYWDFVDDTDKWWGKLKESSSAGTDNIFPEDSNHFYFKGLIANSSQSGGVEYGYICDDVTITELLLVTSQEQTDMVKIVIEGVASKPMIKFPKLL